VEAVAADALDPAVVDRLLEQHLRLAQGVPSAERFLIFAELAIQLREEAVRLARQPGGSELPVVVRLYARVVEEGVVRRAAHLNGVQQRQLLPAVVAQLRQTEREVERAAAEVSPSQAALLRSLSATARNARARLSPLLGEKA
jgi:hypothetical protein